jgi:hypothetical protein
MSDNVVKEEAASVHHCMMRLHVLGNSHDEYETREGWGLCETSTQAFVIQSEKSLTT